MLFIRAPATTPISPEREGLIQRLLILVHDITHIIDKRHPDKLFLRQNNYIWRRGHAGVFGDFCNACLFGSVFPDQIEGCLHNLFFFFTVRS